MKRKISKVNNIYGWIFTSLASAIILVFGIIPIFSAMVISTQSGTGLVTKFVGLKNYIRLFSDPMFITAVKNTFTFLLVQLPIMLVLALIIAKMLNRPNLKGRTLFRIAIFLPCVTSLVAYSVILKSMFANDGLINEFLLNLHIIKDPIQWLMDPFWAKVVIIIAITWRWTGYNMVFYLAALQNIDTSIYEAAKIDGASVFQEFTKITIPLLRPIILVTTITSTIGGLQLFDEVQTITMGGPGNATSTISQYIYNLSFKFAPNFGYAATVSFAILFMVILLSIIQFKIGGEKNEK